MNFELILISIAFFLVGILVMARHKIYKYDSSDMLFATKLRVFLSGLLSTLVGAYGLIKLIIDSMK